MSERTSRIIWRVNIDTLDLVFKVFFESAKRKKIVPVD